MIFDANCAWASGWFAPHDAEADVLVAFFHECRNDGVEGTLAAGEYVGTPRFQREKRAAILQDEPHALGGQARAEFVIDALNPAGDVALLVDHRQIGRVAADGIAVRDVAIGFIRIDERGAFFRVRFRQQAFHRDAGTAGIGVIPPHIGVSEFHGLDALMHFDRAERAQ